MKKILLLALVIIGCSQAKAQQQPQAGIDSLSLKNGKRLAIKPNVTTIDKDKIQSLLSRLNPSGKLNAADLNAGLFNKNNFYSLMPVAKLEGGSKNAGNQAGRVFKNAG